jgi:predicted RNA-binding Zn-ribbon protein involved in translation (DUF1610 family)
MTAYTVADADHGPRRRRVILLGASCLALAFALTPNHGCSKEPEEKSPAPALFDFYVTWRCLDCGHELNDRGAPGPRTCPKCGKNEMYVCIRHACPVHGVFPVAFQYNERQKPIRIKVADGEWIPYSGHAGSINARCPRCGRLMMPSEVPRPAPPEEETGKP